MINRSPLGRFIKIVMARPMHHQTLRRGNFAATLTIIALWEMLHREINHREGAPTKLSCYIDCSMPLPKVEWEEIFAKL